MIDLATPLVLLLLPLPLLLRRLRAPAPAGLALGLPAGAEAALRRRAARGAAANVSRATLWSWAIWSLLLLALAGPRQLEPTPALPTTGRDLVFALDLSGSMVRDDFALDDAPMTRIAAVKKVGAEFVRGRGGDRVALVVFGTEAYFATPFTFDVDAVASAIETAVIGISGRATSISGALGLALKRLSQSEAESRVVILLSDGANNAGATRPRDVARLAAQMGVRVHTIAMAPKSRAEAPGERGTVDAVTLEAMADLTGGTMFRVKTLEDLEAVARDLDALEGTEQAGLAAEVYRSLWIWPAGLALLLCFFVTWREEEAEA